MEIKKTNFIREIEIIYAIKTPQYIYQLQLQQLQL